MIARLLYASCIISVFAVSLLIHLVLNTKRYLLIILFGAIKSVRLLPLWVAPHLKPLKERLPYLCGLSSCMAAMVALYIYILYPQPPLPTVQTEKKLSSIPAYRVLPPHITRGSIRTMEIALTFDGGEYAGQTEEILRILKTKGIKTTIFLTGKFMKRHPELVKKMLQDGHEIGNHTMNHPHLTTYATTFSHETIPEVTKEFLEKELKETERLFYRITGKKMAPLWRAPYGEINDEILGWAQELGYIHVGWTADYKRRETLDTLDWVSDPSSPFYLTAEEIKERILNFGRDAQGLRGGIILMHLDTGRRKDRASDKLGDIIDTLKKKGYRFVKITELLKSIYIERIALKERLQLKAHTP